MEKEAVDLGVLLKTLSEMIVSENARVQSNLALCCGKFSDCEKNSCVGISFKYIKRLFTLKFSVEKALEMSKQSAIDQLGDDASKMNVLNHYLVQSRFDFFVGIFSLFEDFISLIVESTLTPEEYSALKPDIRKILKDEEIKKLLQERFKDKFEEIKNGENHISIPRKVKTFKVLNDEEKNAIHFFSTVRNIMHRNGFYSGAEKEFKEFNKTFRHNELVSITMKEVIDWSNIIFTLTQKLSENYMDRCIPDKTMCIIDTPQTQAPHTVQ